MSSRPRRRKPATRSRPPSATGYRHIDTAAAYGNEREVGEALRDSGVPRSEVFVETKVWISDYGYDETLHAFDKSAAKLGLRPDRPADPAPGAAERLRPDARRPTAPCEQLLADGRVRAIGVSNFMVEHLTRLVDETEIVPAVNQIELHPYFQQRAVQALDAEHGIVTQAWSPIGGITFYREAKAHQHVAGPDHRRHRRGAFAQAPAQVMLRWHLQQGRSVIPKSTKPHRIAENFDVFDFELTADELAAIDGLDTAERGGPEPAEITLEKFGRDIPEA